MGFTPAMHQMVTWILAVLASFLALARSQPTVTTYTPFQPLPTTPLPPVNSSGNFLWPITSNSQIFSAGSVMNISWESEFSQTNLWAIPNFNWDNPTSLTSNAAVSYFEWTVSCGTNCNVPWLIRAVDAHGDQDGQRNGGFVSAEFWIQDPKSESNTATSESHTSITSSISTSVTIVVEHTSISSSSTKTGAPVDPNKGDSVPSTMMNTRASTVEWLSPTENPPSASSAVTLDESAAATTGSVGLGKQATIGIGVGLGSGIAATAVILSWAIIRRHHKQRVRSRCERQGSIDSPQAFTVTPKKPFEPVELQAQTPRMYFEAPSGCSRPQELSTS